MSFEFEDWRQYWEDWRNSRNRSTIPHGPPKRCPTCNEKWERDDFPNLSRLPRMYCENCGIEQYYRRTKTGWEAVYCKGLIAKQIESHNWIRKKINGKQKTVCRYCKTTVFGESEHHYVTSRSVIEDMLTSGELSRTEAIQDEDKTEEYDDMNIGWEVPSDPAEVWGTAGGGHHYRTSPRLREPFRKRENATRKDIEPSDSAKLPLEEDGETARVSQLSPEMHMTQIAKENTKLETGGGAGGSTEKDAEQKAKKRFMRVDAYITLKDRYNSRMSEKITPLFEMTRTHSIIQQSIPEGELNHVLKSAMDVVKEFDYSLFRKNEPVMKHERHMLDDRQIILLTGAAIYFYGKPWLTQDQIIQVFPAIGNRENLNSHLSLIRCFNQQ